MGSKWGLRNLGVAYLEGRGIDKDLDKAAYCFLEALTGGLKDDSKQFLDEIYDETTKFKK